MIYLISDDGAAMVPPEDVDYFIRRGFRIVTRKEYWEQVDKLTEPPLEPPAEEPPR